MLRGCALFTRIKGVEKGKALLHSKGAFPCYEEGVSLHQRGRLLACSK